MGSLRPGGACRAVVACVVLCLLSLAERARANCAPAGRPEGGEGTTKMSFTLTSRLQCTCECRPVEGAPEVLASVPPAEGSGRQEGGKGDRPEAGAALPPEPAPALLPGSITGEVIVTNTGGPPRTEHREVVVYIESMPQRRFAPLRRVRRMVQRDKQFAPRLMVVTKGSEVSFPNEDKFFHNVFSLSEGNVFDLGLYRAGTSKSIKMERAGVVEVYCNIHAGMWAQIVVLDNPFYSLVGSDGTFEIAKVPPGTYTLAARALGGDPVRQTVRVEPDDKAKVRFQVPAGASVKTHLNKFNQPYGRYR